MTRKEKIEKLRQIKLIITNLTATYDMGLEYTIITSKGGDVNLGNIVNWPITEVLVTDEVRSFHKRILEGEKIFLSDIKNVVFFNSILSYHSTPWSEAGYISDEDIEESVSSICYKMKTLDLSEKHIYAFVTLESWNKQIEFFDTYSELESFVIEELGSSIQDYESMSEEEIDYYYNSAEDEGWQNTMPMFKNTEENE